VIDLSKYLFEVLHKDEEFILSRGRRESDGSAVPVRSPVTEYPAPEILKWLEHAYSPRERLDPAWAVQHPNQIAMGLRSRSKYDRSGYPL
jgi:hypothetical protein